VRQVCLEQNIMEQAELDRLLDPKAMLHAST
jgi:aspartate ammonia-lyase